MLGHRSFIKRGMHYLGLASFQKTFSRIDHNDVWLQQGAQCSLIVLLYFGITLHTLYFIPTQSHVQAYPSRTQFFNLNFVEEQENGAGAKSYVCVLWKKISKCK